MTETTKEKRYYEGVGHRKSSMARVRITPAARSTWAVNGKVLEEYFHTAEQERCARAPLAHSKVQGAFVVSVQVRGGGASSQSEAVRHGLARALVLYNPELRSALRAEGWLTRDARSKERRKFGLKKARKAPQWSKR